LEKAADRITGLNISSRKYEDDELVVLEEKQRGPNHFSDYHAEPRMKSAKLLQHMYGSKVRGLDEKEKWKVQQREINDKMMRSGIDSIYKKEHRQGYPAELKHVLALTGLSNKWGHEDRTTTDLYEINETQAIRRGRRIRESLIRLCSAIDESGLRLAQVFTAIAKESSGKAGFSNEFGLRMVPRGGEEDHITRSDFLLACKRMDLGLSSNQLLQMSSALFGGSNDNKSIGLTQFVDIMAAVYKERQAGIDMALRMSLEEENNIKLSERVKKLMLKSIEKGATVIAETQALSVA